MALSGGRRRARDRRARLLGARVPLPRGLEVWRHPFWEECAQDGLEEYVTFVESMKARDLPVKLGIEVDWIPGREDSIAALLGSRPWDYVIGSVHFIADRAVDHDGYDAWDSATRTRSGAPTSTCSAMRRPAACSTSSRTPTS